MNGLTKKIGLVLVSTLMLVSMFGGAALAKPQAEKLQNEKIYSNMAYVMQKAEDPVSAFYAFSEVEQERVRSAMRVHYKEMESIVDNAKTDDYPYEEMQKHWDTMPESLAYIIDIDFTHLEGEERLEVDGGHAVDCFLSQYDQESNESSSGSCPGSYPCYTRIRAYYAVRGTITGDINWEISCHIDLYHNDTEITSDGDDVDSSLWVHNGWKKKAGEHKTQGGNANYLLNGIPTPEGNPVWAFAGVATCQVTHLLHNQWGEVKTSGGMFAYGECDPTTFTATGKYESELIFITYIMPTFLSAAATAILLINGPWALAAGIALTIGSYYFFAVSIVG